MENPKPSCLKIFLIYRRCRLNRWLTSTDSWKKPEVEKISCPTPFKRIRNFKLSLCLEVYGTYVFYVCNICTCTNQCIQKCRFFAILSVFFFSQRKKNMYDNLYHALKVHKHEIILNFFFYLNQILKGPRKFLKKFRFFSFDFRQNFDVRTFPRWLSIRGSKFFLRDIKKIFLQNLHFGPIR